LHEVLEGWVIDVIADLQFALWVLGVLSLEGFVVDFSNIDGVVVEQVRHSHSVLSKSSGFVRADARGRSQSLNRLEVLDKHEFVGHSLGGQSQRHSDGGKETFWNVSDNNSNGEHKGVDNIISVKKGEDEESNSEEHGNGRDDEDKSIDFNGKWGLFLLSRLSEVGDLSNNGVVSNSKADTFSLSSSTLGSEESNVWRFKNVLLGFSWNSQKFFWLSGKRSVGDFHFLGLEDDKIAWDVVSSLDDDSVSSDNLLSSNSLSLSVSDNNSFWGNKVFELSHHLSGLRGLLVRENSSNHNDGDKHDSQVKVGLVFLLGRNSVSDEAENSSEPKKKREESGKFVQEDAVPWKNVLLREGVLSVLLESLLSSSRVHTLFNVSVQLRDQLFNRDDVVSPLTNSFSTLNGLIHSLITFLFL
jgi:hypothetical protein